MSTLTIRLPDDTHARMKVLARHRAMSVNKLMEELCTIAVTQHDAETRFRALAARGSVDEGLRILDEQPVSGHQDERGRSGGDGGARHADRVRGGRRGGGGGRGGSGVFERAVHVEAGGSAARSGSDGDGVVSARAS